MCRIRILQGALTVLAVCTCGFGSWNPAVPQAQKPLLSAQQVFKRVSPSVMVVESLNARGAVVAFGSGVVIAPGCVITNRHVIEDGVSFRVVHSARKWPAQLMKVDPDHDLAELSVAGLDAPAVTVLDSSKLEVGETVFAIGAPEGLELTISEGLISGLRDFDKGRVIQTSAAISPGSSGGGLFDTQGRLVGITTFYLKEGQSLNFALPAEWTTALNRQAASPSPAWTKSSPAFQALVWFEVGYTADEAGRHAEAVTAYKEALRLKPDEALAWVNLGVAYAGLGQHDKAVNAEQEAIRLKPDDALAWLNLGFAYGHLGQYDKMVSAEQEAIRLKPDEELAWFDLGVAYGHLRQYDNEVSAEQEAIRLKPDDADAWTGLGFAYDHLGQYDKAVNAEQEALRLKPDEALAWRNLGVAYAGLGQHDKAVRAEQEAIRLKPDDAAAWFDLGFAYDLLGQHDKAVRAEQEAIRLKPDDEAAWFDLGLAYHALGQQSEVIKVYEKLKTLDPKLADEFFKLAVLP